MFSWRGVFDGLSALAPASRYLCASLRVFAVFLFPFWGWRPFLHTTRKGGQLLPCPSLQASCLPQGRVRPLGSGFMPRGQ